MKASEYIKLLEDKINWHGDFDITLKEEFTDSLNTVQVLGKILDYDRVNLLYVEYGKLVPMLKLIFSLNKVNSEEVDELLWEHIIKVEGDITKILNEVLKIKDTLEDDSSK